MTDFFDVIASQQATRYFDPRPVPERLIWRILEAAGRAPSGANEQPWRWLVVRDDERRAAIAAAVRIGEGPRLTSLEDEARTTDDERRRVLVRAALHLIDHFDAAPVLVVPCLYHLRSPVPETESLLAGSSIYPAVQNLMLAARAVGVGTVLTTFHRKFDATLRRVLEIPPDATPVCIIPMGFPLHGFRTRPTNRKPVEALTFWDTWGTIESRGDRPPTT